MIHFKTFIQNITPFLCLNGKEQMELHHLTKLPDSKLMDNSMLHKCPTEILTAISKDSTESSSNRELVSSEKINRKLFEKCQIVLDLPLTLKMKEKQELRKKIIDNGGIVSYMVTKMTKFVICVEANISSIKQKMAKRFGIPVVREEYIDTCLENEKLLDTKSFLISNEIHLNEFHKGKIFVNSNAEQQFRPVEVSLYSLTIYPYEDLSGYELIKPVILKERMHKISTNNVKYNFCVIELHASSNKENIDISKQFCIFVEEGQIKAQNENDVESKKFCYYLESAEKALSTFSQLYFSKTKSPYYMTEVMELMNPNIGSPAFQKLQLEWSSLSSHINKNVLNLVELIWTEAIGELKKYLKHPENIALWKVDEAESILLQIQSVLNEGSEELAEKLSKEFYSILPHVSEYDQPIVSKKLLSQKKDLCELLRDMVSVSEASGWSPNGHLHAKYKALRCYIQALPSDSEEFNEINNCVTDSQFRPTCIKIQNIYAIYRDIEYAEYTNHISNRQLLLHSTLPSNIVGILSRGLNLPKIVVEEYGIKRTDIGMLGNGIYFTNSASTCIKYSATNKMRNTRFILVSEVALGKVYNTKKFQTSLTNPPDGFDSVHGVKTSETEVSDFQDDEFVIYNPHQQRLKYLIEFSLPDDDVKPYPDISDILKEETSKNKYNYKNNDITLDFEDEDSSSEETDDKEKAGLKLINNSRNIEIPLKSVDVRAKIIDLVSEVTVLQVYENNDDSSVEAKYVFPLEVGAAVCGFEAFINNKHIIGKIKEKETAHKEYKEAVQKGYGAYLMDEEAPNIFMISVGNIPPKTTVIIKITYIIELPIIDEVINFNIPGSVAPWHKQLLAETQDITSTINILDMKGSFDLQISIEMPFPIHIISSPTHKIKIKRTETKAVVKLEDNVLGDGFTLCISLKEIHVPRMWIENHPDEDSQACMMIFYPEFEVVSNPHPEIIIALDASNSMKGMLFTEALTIAIFCLKSLPHNCYFNIVAFGSVFHELFPTCQIYNSTNMEKALNFLRKQTPELGNTELFRVLKYYQRTSGNRVKNIILVSDGNINNERAVLQSAKSYSNKVRVFTMAWSTNVFCFNKHMLQQIANKSGGVFEGLDYSSLKNWKKSVMKQIERTIQASITNIKIEWGNSVDDFKEVIQAPKQITSIFNGCRQIIYGLSTDFNLVKLIAEIDGQEFETVLYTPDLSATKGTMLHTLAAQHVIKDWEDGLLADDRVDQLTEKKCNKEKIIDFSKKFNLITSLTSFIGVEKRSEDEDFSTDEFDLKNDLLNEIDVDFLFYMGFENDSIQNLDEMHLSEITYFRADRDFGQRLSAPCAAEYAPSDAEYAPSDAEYASSDAEYAPCDAEYASSDAEYAPCDAAYLAGAKRDSLCIPPSYSSYKDYDISLSLSDRSRDIDSSMQQDSPLEENAEEILLQSSIENTDKKEKKTDKEQAIRTSLILDSSPIESESRVQLKKKRKKCAVVLDDENDDNPKEVEFKKMITPELLMADSDMVDYFDIVTTQIPTEEGISRMSKSSIQTQSNSAGWCFGSAPNYIPASTYRSSAKPKQKMYNKTEHLPPANLGGFGFSPEFSPRNPSFSATYTTPYQLSTAQSIMGKQQLSESNLKKMVYCTPFSSVNDPRISLQPQSIQLFNNEQQQQQTVKFGDMEITVDQRGITSKPYIMNTVFSDLKEWLKCKGGLPLCDMICFNLQKQAIKTDEKDLLNFIENIPYYQNIVLEPDNSFKDSTKKSSSLGNKLIQIYEIIDKNGGFCSEFDILKAGILKKSFQSDLEDAGLKSLGEIASNNIVLMLSTLAVLIFFALSEIQNFQKQNESDTEFTKLQNFASILAEKLFNNSRKTLVKALRFVMCTHHKYPLACQSLGFQNNWETFIFDFINEPAEALNDQLFQVA